MFLLAGFVDVLEKMLPQGGQSNLRYQQNHSLPRDPEEVLELGLRLIQLRSYQRELGITEPLQRLGLKSLRHTECNQPISGKLRTVQAAKWVATTITHTVPSITYKISFTPS